MVSASDQSCQTSRCQHLYIAVLDLSYIITTHLSRMSTSFSFTVGRGLVESSNDTSSLGTHVPGLPCKFISITTEGRDHITTSKCMNECNSCAFLRFNGASHHYSMQQGRGDFRVEGGLTDRILYSGMR